MDEMEFKKDPIWVKRIEELEDKYFRSTSVVVTTIIGLSAGGILTLFKEHPSLSSMFLVPIVIGLIQLHVQYIGNYAEILASESKASKSEKHYKKEQTAAELHATAIVLCVLLLVIFLTLLIAAVFKAKFFLSGSIITAITITYLYWLVRELS